MHESLTMTSLTVVFTKMEIFRLEMKMTSLITLTRFFGCNWWFSMCSRLNQGETTFSSTSL